MNNDVQHAIFKYLILGHGIIFQIRISFHTTNIMGSKHSKKKYNKEGENQKLFKAGLGLGRNQLKVEGNFQLGYHSKIKKKYEAVDGKPLAILPEEEYEAVDGKPLAVIPEEEEQEEENGRVPDTDVLQS